MFEFLFYSLFRMEFIAIIILFVLIVRLQGKVRKLELKSKLPQGQATQTFSPYQENADIKQALIEISWRQNAVQKNVKMETLIYRYGI